MTRGGKREGAGRKPAKHGEKRRALTVRLPPNYVEWVCSREISNDRYIERLIKMELERINLN